MAEATTTSDELYPIAVLIDELKVSGRSETGAAVSVHPMTIAFGRVLTASRY
jgi:hypothetical protein